MHAEKLVDSGDPSGSVWSAANPAESGGTTTPQLFEQLILLTREEWIGPPPWLTARGRRWWMEAELSSRPAASMSSADRLMESAPLASLIITIMTLVAMLITLVGLALVGRVTGDSGRIAIAADGSILLWLSTALSTYVLSLALSLATQHRESALEETFPGEYACPTWMDPRDSLGLAEAGPGLLASDRDRLWIFERLEAAEGLGLLSPFGFGALSIRTVTRSRVEELYEVLIDAVRYPTAQQVECAIGDAMWAVAEGRISEEELNPLLERLAYEGSPEALACTASAYVCRPTGADRAQAQAVLDEAFARGQLSPRAFTDRSERLDRARTTPAVADALEGLRWHQPTRPTNAMAVETTYDIRAHAASWFWSAVKFAAALGPTMPATSSSVVVCKARLSREEHREGVEQRDGASSMRYSTPQSSLINMRSEQAMVDKSRSVPG